MPTYLLDSGATVELHPRPVRVAVTVDGGGAARIQVRTVAGGGTTVVQPRPDLVVLPVVAAAALITVTSTAGPFPAAATVSVDVSVEGAVPGDPDHAVLSRIRIGGLLERELVVIERSGEVLTARAVSMKRDDLDLGRLGNAARTAAAALLGMATVDESAALNVVVAADASASFRPRAADGTLDAVLSVLAGVASVVAPDLRLGAAVVGTTARLWETTSPDRLRAEVAGALATEPRHSWFASGSEAFSRFDPDRNTQVYLVTDAQPADLEALEQANREDGQARHLVAICPEPVWQAFRPSEVPATVVEPPRGTSIEDRLLGEPGLLQRTVRSLLQGCFVPGTTAYERVAL